MHVDLMCNLYNRLMFVQFDDDHECVREGTDMTSQQLFYFVVLLE